MNKSAVDLDRRVRLAAFAFLTEKTESTSDGVLSPTILATGFTFSGTRVPRIGPQGIFKPAIPPEIPYPSLGSTCRSSRTPCLGVI